ncbi:MAG: type II toxin-antitoxin system VapC family toxin [Chloroflexota bacterium]
MSSVLDASAVLALMFGEPGTERVQDAIDDGAVISAVNVTEVMSRQIDRGVPPPEARLNVQDLGLHVVPFDEDLAYRAALLRAATRSAGLSLGDRACLALAERMAVPAITADRAWSGLNLGMQIDTIR